MSKIHILFVHTHTRGFLGDIIRIENMLKFLKDNDFIIHEICLPSLKRPDMKDIVSIITHIMPPNRLEEFPNFKNHIFLSVGLNVWMNIVDYVGLKLGPHIILAENSIVGWLGLQLSKKLSVPCVVDVHGLVGAEAKGDSDRHWPLFKMLEDEVFNNVDHLLVVSKAMKNYIVHHYDRPPDEITVVYNGSEVQSRIAKFDYPLRVIYAGNFAPYEKVDDYLELAKRANTRDFKFFLAGKGTNSQTKHILSRIKREKINIRYLGYVPRTRMLEMLSNMQVGISPSSTGIERLVAFPIKVLDYMACGLPVITPKIGDWGHVVERENSGIALKDDSSENHLKALWSLTDKFVWNEKSRNGIQVIKTTYSWDKVLSPTKDIIVQLTRK